MQYGNIVTVILGALCSHADICKSSIDTGTHICLVNTTVGHTTWIVNSGWKLQPAELASTVLAVGRLLRFTGVGAISPLCTSTLAVLIMLCKVAARRRGGESA